MKAKVKNNIIITIDKNRQKNISEKNETDTKININK